MAAARAGASVSILGAVGADAFGAEAIEYLVQESIDISLMQQIKGSNTGTALINIDENGENSIPHARELD